MKPGDFFLLHEGGLEACLIQAGTHSHWNHAGLITSESGETLEALSTGLTAMSLSRFAPESYIVVDSGLTDLQRAAACVYGTTCLGQQYDWLDIAGITVDIIAHATLVFGTAKHVICSAFVALCYQQAGATPPDDPRLISPGRLARWFGVVPQ